MKSLCPKCRSIYLILDVLQHCGSMTTYGDRELGQQWLGKYFCLLAPSNYPNKGRFIIGLLVIFLWWKFHKYGDGIKWKHFPRYWPFVRGIHMTSLNSPYNSQIFDVFFHLRLDKRLKKQSKCWWFQTPSRSLWRYCNEVLAIYIFLNEFVNYLR